MSYNIFFDKLTIILFFFNDFCSHICYPVRIQILTHFLCKRNFNKNTNLVNI